MSAVHQHDEQTAALATTKDTTMEDKITEALDAMNAARAAWKSGSTDRVTALALHDNWLEACAYWRAMTAGAAAKKGG